MFESGKWKQDITIDINLLKQLSPNKKHQMLPCYLGENKPNLSNFNFEAAKEVLITAEKPMVEKDVLRE